MKSGSFKHMKTNNMSSLQELKSVVKDTLETRGVLGQIKARLRAEVFNALDDQAEPRPTLSNENMLINELIREYLEFNKYKYTASVLLAESGQPTTPLDRGFLSQELNISEDRETASVPLLYGVVAHFLSRNKPGGTMSSSKYGSGRQEACHAVPERDLTSDLAADANEDNALEFHGGR